MKVNKINVTSAILEMRLVGEIIGANEVNRNVATKFQLSTAGLTKL